MRILFIAHDESLTKKEFLKRLERTNEEQLRIVNGV